MNERLVVLVPTAHDLTPDGRQYFDNFVWRVQRALTADQLNARVAVAEVTYNPLSPRPAVSASSPETDRKA